MAYALLKRGSSRGGFFAITKGDPPLFVSNKQLVSWHLHEGQELDEEGYRRLCQLKQADDCRNKALDLLALREHTALELRQKLTLKNYPKETIESTIASLKAEGSLSEQRYAEMLVRSRQKRNPEGKAVLMQRLQAKGVSHADAKAAVDEAWEEQGDEFLRNAWLIAERTTKDQEKLQAKLIRKGFSYGDVKRMRDIVSGM